MDVESALRQVNEAYNKHVGTEAHDEWSGTYREAFEKVDEIGGGAAVEELLGHVANHVREEEERPTAAEVDRYAREALAATGNDVPDDVSITDA